jgi:hypothetical protein
MFQKTERSSLISNNVISEEKKYSIDKKSLKFKVMKKTFFFFSFFLWSDEKVFAKIDATKRFGINIAF